MLVCSFLQLVGVGWLVGLAFSFFVVEKVFRAKHVCAMICQDGPFTNIFI
jgi:hypothetical protein